MKTLIKLSILSVFLLGLQGCNDRPRLKLPKLHTVKIIPKQYMNWELDGSMKTKSAQRAYKQLVAYNKVEKYYRKEILEYNILREKIIKDNK